MVEPQSQPTSLSNIVMFQEFQALYPTGSLTSELVMVQEQTFVVRVQLRWENQNSVTALAADKVLEVAEDRARQRAFALLDLPAHPSPASTQGVLTTKSTKATEAPKVKTSDMPPTNPVGTEPDLPPEEAELTPPLDLIPDPGAPTTISASPSVSTGKPQVTPVEASVPTLIHQEQTVTETLPMPAPIDLSDVIAQTDVELKRLAWSVKDGRDYLEQTYRKRSRHDLTDEELLAFLLHLESLPTPATT
jgi:hypothetical protein